MDREGKEAGKEHNFNYKNFLKKSLLCTTQYDIEASTVIMKSAYLMEIKTNKNNSNKT